MNKVSLLGVGFAVATGLICWGGAWAQPTGATSPAVVDYHAGGFEYARLSFDGDLVGWQAGESGQNVQVVPLDTLYRRLGGNSRPGLVNLLNTIGKDGWELVTTDESNWTFKRPR